MGIFAGRCWSICWTHLRMFSVSTRRPPTWSRCQASWPLPTTTLDRKKTTKRSRYVWWVEDLVLCFRSVHGWIGMDVLVNVWGLRSICQASWPSPTTTLGRKGTSEWRRHVWRVEGFALFILGVCIAGWEWMCEWTSSECHFCAQTLDRGERCLGPDLQCPR